MATHIVDILIKGRDQISSQFSKVGTSATVMSSLLRQAANAIGIYFSARSIYNLAKASVEAYGREELAIRRLTDALSLLGPRTKNTIKGMQDFAAEIQRQTTFADEEILSVMTLGATIGKLEGDALKKATIAAIGLSKGFGIELEQAMRLVSKGAVGISTGLKRLGINIKECRTEQETFNLVLATGISKYSIATGEIETQTGAVIRLKNAWGDLKETMGGAISPAVKGGASWLKQTAEAMKGAAGEEGLSWIYAVRVIQIGILEGVRRDIERKTESASAAFIKRMQEKTKMPRPLSIFEERRRAASEEWEAERAIIEKDKTLAKQTLASKIIEQWKEAKQKIEDYGLSEAQLLSRQMKEAGIGFMGRRQIEGTYKELQFQKTQDEMTGYLKDLRDQLATEGMSQWQQIIYELKKGGVAEQLPLFGQFQNIVEDLARIRDAEAFKMHEGGVAPLVSRFLTMFPSAKIDHQKAISENTKKQVLTLEQIRDRLDELVGNRPTLELVGAKF